MNHKVHLPHEEAAHPRIVTTTVTLLRKSTDIQQQPIANVAQQRKNALPPTAQ